MKKLFPPLLLVIASFIVKGQPCSFSVNSISGNYSLTCNVSSITLIGSPAALNYTWTGPGSGTVSGGIATCTSAGIYTVSASGNGCTTFSQVVIIGTNTTAPTNAVNPTSQAITCNSGSPVTFSATVSNPTTNILTEWYSPLSPLPTGGPIASGNTTLTVLTGSIPPGVYTVVTTNQANGCKTQKTVTVTSLSAWPTFSLSMNPSLQVSCANPNVTLCIVNAVSTQTPPGTVSFSFVAPGSALPSPSVVLGPNNCTVSNVTGVWTVVVQDNSNFCRTMLPVTITSNTVAPTFSIFPGNASVCPGNSATLVASGANSYVWNPGAQTGWSIVSTPISSINYTVIGTGANGCTTSVNYLHGTLASPAVTLSTNMPTLCAGQPATLTATGANTYTWNPGNLTGNTVVVTPSINTTYTVTSTGTTTCNGIANIVQPVNICTGIEVANGNENDLLVYPNPSSGEINIRSSASGSIRLYDLTGKIIYNEKVKGGSEQKLNDLKAGVYMLELRTDEKKSYKKVSVLD